jgi:ABC-2 type transport system ATP-binding protein
MSAVIEVKDLKREYRGTKGWFRGKKETVKAVDGISFAVERGEIFGLLGQNGAGKTTTIKMLITLLAPTCGTCKVLGYDTFGEEKHIRKRINFIFGGEMGVYRRLSARDNLKYFANLYYLNPVESKKRIEEILELVGLSERADALAETYSKGMIQRLQIARGLINDPEILFMDEPTVGLDPLGARALREIIRRLKEQGKTVLLTTHYMPEAEELCDRIAIINKGKLVAIGTPEELKKGVNGIGILELKVDRALAEQLRQLEAIAGVTTVKAQEENGETRIVLTHLSDADITGEVIFALRGCRVSALSGKEPSLEDAYIRLVEGAQ